MSSQWPGSMCRKSLTRTLCCDAQLSGKLQAALWRGDVDRLLFASAPLQVKDRCIVARYEDEQGSLLVKRHIWGGLSRTLRMALREPSARRCARIGQYFSQHGIPTPRPRAWVEQRLGLFGYRSYLFTDFIEGTPLYRFVRAGEASADDLEHLAEQVAEIWQRFVELGASHGDMKPENFIVDADLRVWVLDLERTRLGGSPRRQSMQQVADVETFLHLRGWHQQPEAREIFRRALARTEAGRRLGLSTESRSASATVPAAEHDPTLAVLLLCDDAEQDSHYLQRAIESVRDFTDDVLIAPCGVVGDQFEEVKQLALRGQNDSGSDWLLVLHHNECVTPVLAKRLQEAITGPANLDAYRIAIERQFFGRSLAVSRGAGNWPIRLLRHERCSSSVANGELAIAADPERTGELEGTIQQSVASTVSELVRSFDRETTAAASRRLRKGERPRWIAAAVVTCAGFVRKCVTRDGVRSGWVGLHLALLEAVFAWIEELKLWQMSGQFHSERSAMLEEDVDPPTLLPQVRRLPSSASEVPAAKAA